MNDLHGHKWLIIANGLAEIYQKKSLQSWMKGRISVALDGAAHLLAANFLRPDILLGDFDSIDKSLIFHWKSLGVHCLHMGSQELTDMEKSLRFAICHGARNIYIINASGGRMDHSLGNVFFLKKYASRKVRIILHSGGQCLEYLWNQTRTLHSHSGAHCGFFGMTNARITSHGLRYEMDNFPLKMGGQASIANQFVLTHAKIIVHGACLASYGFLIPQPF
ncbi:MAG: thiamine diphosphokinase [Puniceicoccales bacterium]|jgi:thiamine pyrophosphokinase|nr:thiamine diphosphokinase [Puniceicoccales bacterium]